MPVLQFQPLTSRPTASFWSALTSYKLDKAKLDDSIQSIEGWMEEGRTIQDTDATFAHQGDERFIGIDGSLVVAGNAFGDDIEKPPLKSIPVGGFLKNFNTIEEFRQVDSKRIAFDRVVELMVESFSTDKPILNPFLLVTFADLKRYTYHYWFAFPALVTKPVWETEEQGFTPADPSEVEALRDSITGVPGNRLTDAAFLIKKIPSGFELGPLSAYGEFFSQTPLDQRSIAFHDPSSSGEHPGWPLRNVLYYLFVKHNVDRVRVICLREGTASRHGIVQLPVGPRIQSQSQDLPSAVGWERDGNGKLSSRLADLASSMDPTRLAEQAVDLNLKLMKWRVMPTIDLQKIARTKCLLLGAGTLGCYVARNLMAWGVRNITFVDSGTVSFSNPVRQPLFLFDDCLNGGADKAHCAAKRLRQVFPGVNANSFKLAIPMPGHRASPQLETDLATLVDLFHEHDAVFLLMDSRESRWLPTVIGASQGKMVINAALGFDTYLVMRHGPPRSAVNTSRLGCYFCNDVVAPADSLTDRTLDQMCTVTRPGVAPIAAATAVELFVTILQNPLGWSTVPHLVDAPAVVELSPKLFAMIRFIS
ncbi:E1-like protein-activating enzyme Gsa7p/Apg7p [Kwoniella heveanensis BCC8398]|uniref:E1-like protein-activating enzyme Gsa7p/Apg7p n=1 Tax=Kwoniella heveanensis BCC8398 TaxID=1296120 RepID=A0A1B9H2V1_9TREE|nr:E1-like protein-activating enzyme Gsa7p/Apg7p [Kwoniella heveanensis BCC8398]